MFRPTIKRYSHVFAIDEFGNIVSSLQDPNGSYHGVTGALDLDGWLYVSSLFEDRMGCLDLALQGTFTYDEYP